MKRGPSGSFLFMCYRGSKPENSSVPFTLDLLGGHSGSFNHVKGAQDTFSYPVSDYLIYTPDLGWQLSSESVAAFEWNVWQASNGISGRLGPEYAGVR